MSSLWSSRRGRLRFLSITASSQALDTGSWEFITHRSLASAGSSFRTIRTSSGTSPNGMSEPGSCCHRNKHFDCRARPQSPSPSRERELTRSAVSPRSSLRWRAGWRRHSYLQNTGDAPAGRLAPPDRRTAGDPEEVRRFEQQLAHRDDVARVLRLDELIEDQRTSSSGAAVTAVGDSVRTPATKRVSMTLLQGWRE